MGALVAPKTNLNPINNPPLLRLLPPKSRLWRGHLTRADLSSFALGRAPYPLYPRATLRGRCDREGRGRRGTRWRRQVPVCSLLVAAALAVVFVVELSFPIRPADGISPGIDTLRAMGALSGRPLSDGRYYSLLVAPFLHADGLHLFSNVVGIVLAGCATEALLSGSWFVTLFVVGCLGGALCSALANPPSSVSVSVSERSAISPAPTDPLGSFRPLRSSRTPCAGRASRP